METVLRGIPLALVTLSQILRHRLSVADALTMKHYSETFITPIASSGEYGLIFQRELALGELYPGDDLAHAERLRNVQFSMRPCIRSQDGWWGEASKVSGGSRLLMLQGTNTRCHHFCAVSSRCGLHIPTRQCLPLLLEHPRSLHKLPKDLGRNPEHP